jgi:hypothetical protein
MVRQIRQGKQDSYHKASRRRHGPSEPNYLAAAFHLACVCRAFNQFVVNAAHGAE